MHLIVARRRYANARVDIVDDDVRRRAGRNRSDRHRAKIEMVQAARNARVATADRSHRHSDDQDLGGDEHRDD